MSGSNSDDQNSPKKDVLVPSSSSASAEEEAVASQVMEEAYHTTAGISDSGSMALSNNEYRGDISEPPFVAPVVAGLRQALLENGENVNRGISGLFAMRHSIATLRVLEENLQT